MYIHAHLMSPLKIWQLRALKCYMVFMEPPYTIVTLYLYSVGLFSHVLSGSLLERKQCLMRLGVSFHIVFLGLFSYVLSGSLFVWTQWVFLKNKSVPHEIGHLLSFRLVGSLFICTHWVAFHFYSLGVFSCLEALFAWTQWVSFRINSVGLFSHKLRRSFFKKKTVPHEVGRLFAYPLIGSDFICTCWVFFYLYSLGLFAYVPVGSFFIFTRWV